MSSRANVVLAIGTAAPLVCLYLLFLSWLISNRVIPGANLVEASILVTQLVRLVLVLSVKRFRMASIVQLWVIFSLEAHSFAVLIALYLFTGNPYMISLASTIIVAWPSAMLCVVPVYVFCRLTFNVWKDHRLISVVPAGVSMFTLFAFLDYVASSQPAPRGLAALSSLLLSTLLQTRSVVATPQAVTIGIPLYLSLLTYGAIQGVGVSPGRNSQLVLVAFGTLLAIGLAVFDIPVTAYPLLVLGLPSAFLVAIMWWMTHAR